MKWIYLIYVVISLILGSAYYFLTRNIWLAVALILAITCFLLFYFDSKRKKFYRVMNRTYEAINFINNFIISLSVSSSLNTALTNAKNSTSEVLQRQIDSIEHLAVEDRIDYLYGYFDIELYGVFINIIKQYTFNGGDIIKISQLLMRDSRNLEDRMHDYQVNLKHKFMDFTVSWGLTIIVLFAMHFSLKNLTANPTDFALYPILIFIFFFLLMANFALLISKAFDASFIAKGDKNEKRT